VTLLQGEYLLEVCRPFEVRVYHCQIRGELTPLGNPTLTLTPLRALSLLTVRSPPVAMALVPPRRVRATTTTTAEAAAEETDGDGAPAQCLVLRAGGELCLLDLIAGGERSLATGVDLFWLTMPAPDAVPFGGSLAVPGTPRRGDGDSGDEGGEGGEQATATEELPWWVYSHRGMQVWYPASPAAASRQSTEDNVNAPPTLVSATTENDPELALDREVRKRETIMDVPHPRPDQSSPTLAPPAAARQHLAAPCRSFSATVFRRGGR
jgi:hypothetical protein